MEKILACGCRFDDQSRIYPVETYPAGAACSLEPQDNGDLAEAYVPNPVYSVGYSPADALARGTLFPELDKPWLE